MRHAEQLETRRLLTSFTASSVAELISDINAANAAGGANTITLAPGVTFNLTAVDNTAHGATGLPVIGTGNDLTIVGNGDTVQRGTTRTTPAFRLFDVAAGASLALSRLTLSGGLAFGVAQGGGIRSEGTLSLSGVAVQTCIAQGYFSEALGGGIFSAGVLAVVDSAIRNNQALAGDGAPNAYQPVPGQTAEGGGLYVAGASMTLTNTTVESNLARGGNGANGGKDNSLGVTIWTAGGQGGNAFGGGIFTAASHVELRGVTITRNTAKAGLGGSSPNGIAKPTDGAGQGGGIYIAPAASAGLDAFTQANTRSNTASTSGNDIFGSFTILA